MKIIACVLVLLAVAVSIVGAAEQPKVSISVQAKQLKDVADNIAQQAGVSIVVDPKAQGTITANIQSAELAQVLDIVTKTTNLTWRKMQFAKSSDNKVPLEQLQATALALASLPLVGLSIEDPSSKTAAVYAKDLTSAPSTSGIKLPDGYEWTTVYVIMPKVDAAAAVATEKTAANVKSVSDAQTQSTLAMIKMTPEERQQVFRNQWAMQMTLPADQRQALMKDQMQAMFGLTGPMRDQLRQDMRDVFRGMRPQGQQTGQGGGHRANSNRNQNH